jgi:hypothetical protein
MMNTKLIRSIPTLEMFKTSAEGYWPSFYVLASEQHNQNTASNPATEICGKDRGNTEVLEGCSVS